MLGGLSKVRCSLLAVLTPSEAIFFKQNPEPCLVCRSGFESVLHITDLVTQRMQ